MPGPRIDELLLLAATAFATDDDHGWSHGLLDNLQSVPLRHWRTIPPGGSRSIEAIALHAGAGEVNHLRSVLEQDDRWAFERGG